MTSARASHGRPQTELDAFKVQLASFLMGAPRAFR